MAAQETRWIGTGQDDELAGTPGADILMGVAGDDTLFGMDGADTLLGGVGDDVLDGGRGSDVLRGGHGSDSFEFSFTDVLASLPQEGGTEATLQLRIGHDVVEDFEVGVDSLLIRGEGEVLGLAQLQGFLQVAEEDADGDGMLDTVLRVDYTVAATGVHYTDPGSSITLLGVSGASLEQLLSA